MRTYRTALKKSGTRTPRVELVDMGPHMDLTMRRSQLASSDLLKLAMKVCGEGGECILSGADAWHKKGPRIYKRVRLGGNHLHPPWALEIWWGLVCHANPFLPRVQVPKTVKPKKVKNVEFDELGNRHGRIHMERQDFDKLQTRKVKGMRSRPQASRSHLVDMRRQAGQGMG